MWGARGLTLGREDSRKLGSPASDKPVRVNLDVKIGGGKQLQANRFRVYSLPYEDRIWGNEDLALICPKPYSIYLRGL